MDHPRVATSPLSSRRLRRMWRGHRSASHGHGEREGDLDVAYTRNGKNRRDEGWGDEVGNLLWDHEPGTNWPDRKGAITPLRANINESMTGALSCLSRSRGRRKKEGVRESLVRRRGRRRRDEDDNENGEVDLTCVVNYQSRGATELAVM